MSPIAKGAIVALVAMVGTAIGVAIVRGRKDASGGATGQDDDEGGDAPGGNVENTSKPIAVGEIGDPAVAPLVAQIQALWDSKGIDFIKPAQFYTMSKAPHHDGPDPGSEAGPILAIPDYPTWERTADFLAGPVREVFAEVARRGGNRADYRTGGYRPADYNAAVGGAPKSRHVDGDAIDIIPLRNVTKNTDILLMAIATVYLRHSGDPIGAGFYAGNGHIDVGHPHRSTWSGKTVPGKDDKYIAKAKKELAIA